MMNSVHSFLKVFTDNIEEVMLASRGKDIDQIFNEKIEYMLDENLECRWPKYREQFFTFSKIINPIEQLKSYMSEFSSGDNEFLVTSKESKYWEKGVFLVVDGKLRHTGKIAGISATGKVIQLRVMFRIEVNPQSNKIRYLELITDSLDAFQQLGKAVLELDDEYIVEEYMNTLRIFGLIK